MFQGGRREGNLRRLGRFQGDLCFHCGGEMAYGEDGPSGNRGERGRLASVEHFVPRSLGGQGLLENLVVAHRRRNNDRRSVMPDAAEKARLEALNADRAELLAEVRQDISEFGL